MAVGQIKVGSWCVRWLGVRWRPFSEYLNICHEAASTLSLPLSLSLSLLCVRVRQEVRQNESSCLCLYRPQCVFKGFNRTHCCITVIILLYCVYVRLYRPEMFAKARMFFQWRLQQKHTSSVWLRHQEARVCASVCLLLLWVCAVCVFVCVWLMTIMCHEHITQRVSIYVVGFSESIFWYFILCRRCYQLCCRWEEMEFLSPHKVNGRVSRQTDYCMFSEQAGPFCTQCKSGSNLAKSVFHLSFEQTGAGEPAPIYYRCEIPAALNLILKQQMDACQVCVYLLKKQAAVLLYN